jgi:type III restriction enzyme
VFAKYQANPEDFLRNAARLINEQKAAVVVEHLTYNEINERYDVDIFTREQGQKDLSSALKVKRHIYDYVFTDSKKERDFVELLDAGTEVEVYAKLPRTFTIPTPVGNYSPDWAIAFKKGMVKHIYFVAETKGTLTSLELRAIEKSKIRCARKFFHKITSNNVKYEVVDGFDTLMKLVQA